MHEQIRISDRDRERDSGDGDELSFKPVRDVLHHFSEHEHRPVVAVVAKGTRSMPRQIQPNEPMPANVVHYIAKSQPLDASAGRRAWTLLHRYRGCDPQWLELWEYFVPAGSCNCKEGYRAILKDYPPDFSSPEAFFEWGVRLHNAVNEKLIDQGDTTKRIVSLDEAYSIWRGKDAGSEDPEVD